MSQCPFCLVIENLCKKLNDKECEKLFEKVQKGEIPAEALTSYIKSKYPSEQWVKALSDSAKEVLKNKK
jgi:lipoate synthase